MEINTVLEELKTAGMSDYELSELASRAARSKVLQLTKLYPDEKLCRVETTISDTVESIIQAYLKKFGDLETAQVFYEFDGYKIRLEKEDTKPGSLIFHKYYQSSNHHIMSMALFSINGTVQHDYKDVIKIEELNKVGYDTAAYKITIENITIQSFCNGKIKFTGMTEDQIQRIKKGFLTVEKYRNIPLTRND